MLICVDADKGLVVPVAIGTVSIYYNIIHVDTEGSYNEQSIQETKIVCTECSLHRLCSLHCLHYLHRVAVLLFQQPNWYFLSKTYVKQQMKKSAELVNLVNFIILTEDSNVLFYELQVD